MRPIILEGPDNAGKSTLAKQIAESRGAIVIPSEGREKYPGEINERVRSYLDLYDGLNVVFDRHPVISQTIYFNIKPNTPVDYDLVVEFYKTNPLFIYCYATTERGMHGHVAKDYDDPNYIKAIEDNFDKLVTEYNKWALKKAHLIYRIGDDVKQLINIINGAML